MASMTLTEAMQMLVSLRDNVRSRADVEGLRFIDHCLRNLHLSHAQFLQDLWISYELKERRGGFFVEFGAGDGVTFSNSCYLERSLGWSGILAEPARLYHPRLSQTRDCFVDRRCVWRASGERLLFNQPAITAHSTLDAFTESDDLAHTRRDGERYEVETVSLNDLLDHWRAPRRIDYLSIDTEGSELEILQAFDFDRYDVRRISVEHNHTPRRQDLHALLTAKGFQRKFEALSFVDDWYMNTYA